jgi:hypothetical protein
MLGRIKSTSLLVMAAAAVGIAACGDTTSPDTSSSNPLKNLIRASAGSGDTAKTGGTGGQQGDGLFHVTVRGLSAPGATDTLNTAPRLANVSVTVYSHVTTSTGDTLGVGPAVAHVTTDANGDFQTPVLPGALYIVTFTPPANSPYINGVYVVATAYAHSGDYPWYIVLQKK